MPLAAWATLLTVVKGWIYTRRLTLQPSYFIISMSISIHLMQLGRQGQDTLKQDLPFLQPVCMYVSMCAHVCLSHASVFTHLSVWCRHIQVHTYRSDTQLNTVNTVSMQAYMYPHIHIHSTTVKHHYIYCMVWYTVTHSMPAWSHDYNSIIA